MRPLTTLSTVSVFFLGAALPLLAGCEASLAARTPAEARLPAPTSDDPLVTDPGATGRVPVRRLEDLGVPGTPRQGPGLPATADAGSPDAGSPDGGVVAPRPAGVAPVTVRPPPSGPRAEPGGPRLDGRPAEWPPGGVTAGRGMPPIPPPPTWDPSLDAAARRANPRPGRPTASDAVPPVAPEARPVALGPVDLGPVDGGPRKVGPVETPMGLPPTGTLPPIDLPSGTARPTGPTGLPPESTTPRVPAQPRDPLLPSSAGTDRPPAPADASDDLGAPPGGSANPHGALPSQPVPTAPRDPQPIDPAPRDPQPIDPAPSDPQPIDPAPSDPLPPIDPAPAKPQPIDPAPAKPQPIDPAPADPQPIDPAPSDPAPSDPAPGDPAPAGDDPWLPGGSEPAPADPQPAQPQPADPKPLDPKPAPVDEDDPWLPGGSGEAPAGTNPATTETPPTQPVVDEDDPWQEGGATSTPGQPTPGQPTPGQPTPTQPMPREPEAGTPMGRAMAHVTKLLDRPGAPEVCGYPAEVVRSDDAGMALTPGVKPVLLVFFDDGMRASDLQAAQLLPMVLRNRQRIDFVAIDRGAGAKRTRGTDELSLRFLDHVPTIVLLDAQRTTRLLRSGRVDAAVVERAIEDAIANPTPAPEKPAAANPGSPDVPESPGSVDPFDQQPQGDDPAARTGVTFTPPSDHSARTHVQRLRSGPGDARVPGYPSDLLPSAPAGRVLGAGPRPCVIVFYDNASKASDLQAAAFLELLVRRRSEIDIVLVDVGTKATWDADQKRVVRTYYNFYVPTTVVLSASRAPVKSWYSRVEAAALDDAIDDALSR